MAMKKFSITDYKYVQLEKDQTAPWILYFVQYDSPSYIYKEEIGRFNFYTNEGYILIPNADKKEFKRFSALLNTIYKYDERFGWNSKLVEDCKKAGANKRKEDKKELDQKEQAKQLERANDYLNKLNNNEENVINALQNNFADVSDDTLIKVIKNNFKNAITDKMVMTILTAMKNKLVELANKENNIAVNTQPVDQTETTNTNKINDNTTQTTEAYIVGNRSFSSYSEAVSYCLQSDFDPSINIQEVAPMQPSNVQTSDIQTSEPITYHFYKQTFNSYMDAYNHALNNRSSVTMILPSNHPYMTNERLQELEKEYVFSKSNMSITDMKEYFSYISSLKVSTDQQDRYYNLKSWIQRHEYKQQQRINAENERQRLSLEGSRLLVFMKEKGLELELTKDKQWYYYKGEHVYSFYSCSVEKYHSDMLNLFNKYFSDYIDEYNNSKVYYYKGNEDTQLSMDDYPLGWISYNHNTYIAVFNRQLNESELSYYNLISCYTDTLKIAL